MEQGGDVSFGGGREMEDIPTSLENLIMDRVHRLGRDTVWLLQAASVLGRQFPMSLAEQVAELNGKMLNLLPHLEQHGLIFRSKRHAVRLYFPAHAGAGCIVRFAAHAAARDAASEGGGGAGRKLRREIG